jgi:hypothetical protein
MAIAFLCGAVSGVLLSLFVASMIAKTVAVQVVNAAKEQEKKGNDPADFWKNGDENPLWDQDY